MIIKKYYIYVQNLINWVLDLGHTSPWIRSIKHQIKLYIFINYNYKIYREFDREVTDQIFEQCSPDNYNQVLVEQFCNIIVTAENILLKKYEASFSQK